MQALLKKVHFKLKKGPRQNAVVYFVAHQANLRLLLKQVSQTFIKVPVHSVDCSDWVHLSCLHQRPQVTTLVCVVVLPQLLHPFAHLLWIDLSSVVLKVELHLLDRTCEHKFVLWLVSISIGSESIELLIDADDLLEIQFLEVDVQPPHEEVYQISLLKLVVSEAPEGLQHLR